MSVRVVTIGQAKVDSLIGAFVERLPWPLRNYERSGKPLSSRRAGLGGAFRKASPACLASMICGCR